MTDEELNKWAKDLCEKLDLPPCETRVHINLDADLGLMGEDGCIVTYEVGNPGRYCISINKAIMDDKVSVFNALYRQVMCYRGLLESDRKKKGE
ncbi:MAG: hypothetical protein MR871_07700 [Lachnospiraceae bacterium]|nr:hypothetical protein [Lachnospiraceae bacterium]